MAEGQTTTAAVTAIRWQEVVELDPKMASADREKIVAALELIQDSNIGQQKFAEAKTLQSTTRREASADKATPNDDSYSMASIVSRREYGEKTFISAIPNNPESLAYQDLATKGGGGHYAGNVILFQMDTALEARVPKASGTGETFAKGPFAETLIHEFQHAIDDQRRLANGGKLPDQACLEDTAIQAGNALLAEKFPAEAKRSSYGAPEIALKEAAPNMKANAPEAFATFAQKTPIDPEMDKLLTKPTVEKWATDLQDNVKLNAGCKGISSEDAVAKTHAMLQRLGVRPELLNLGTGYQPVPKEAESEPKTPAPTNAGASPEERYSGR